MARPISNAYPNSTSVVVDPSLLFTNTSPFLWSIRRHTVSTNALNSNRHQRMYNLGLTLVSRNIRTRLLTTLWTRAFLGRQHRCFGHYPQKREGLTALVSPCLYFVLSLVITRAQWAESDKCSAMSCSSRDVLLYSVAGAVGLTAAAAGLCLISRKAWNTCKASSSL